MTEHIVSFSVGIDDDAIIDSIQKNADRQIIASIKKDVLERVFKSGTYSYYHSNSVVREDLIKGPVLDRDAVLSDFSERIVKEAFVEFKDEIIDKAALYLAESYKRTKAWKEKVAKELEV